MLSIEQLEDLDERLKYELDEHLTQILTRLNRDDRLDELLEILGLINLLKPEPMYACFDNGKIVVLGESNVAEAVLLSIAKDLGLDKKRFEFHLGYDEAKMFDGRKMQWNPAYSLILVGPMPHSGTSKGDASSVITALENTEGYPPVIRLGTNSLKISKSDFRAKLTEAMEKKLIA